MTIQLSITILPNRSMYIYTVEQFFYTNLLWRIREVDLTCYTTDTFNAADVDGGRIECKGLLMSAARVIQWIESFAHADDWIDVLLLNGTRIRNIQRGEYHGGQDHTTW